eukprot:5180732-Ditylum_brightwellii.AAC.1
MGASSENDEYTSIYDSLVSSSESVVNNKMPTVEKADKKQKYEKKKQIFQCKKSHMQQKQTSEETNKRVTECLHSNPNRISGPMGTEFCITITMKEQSSM